MKNYLKKKNQFQLSVFNSGPAWQWNEKRQQYYYHAFQVKQPDFNYRNSMVVEEIKVGIFYFKYYVIEFKTKEIALKHYSILAGKWNRWLLV